MTQKTEQNHESWEEFQKTHVVATLVPVETEEKTREEFTLLYSAKIVYTLTKQKLKFLNNGQPIEVRPGGNCILHIYPPTEQEKPKC